MRKFLIPLAVLALSLPSAVAQEADQPERILTTELPTRGEAGLEVAGLFAAVRADTAALREDAAEEAGEFSQPAFVTDLIADDNALVLALAASSLTLFDDDVADHALPLINQAMDASGPVPSLPAAFGQVMFASALGEIGHEAEARALLNSVREFLLVPPEDSDVSEVARVWGVAGLAWLNTGDISLAREAFARSRFAASDDSYALWAQLSWVTKMARAGYRTEAFLLLHSLLSGVEGRSATMIDLMGPRILPYILIRTGDPRAEAVARDIMSAHLDLDERAQLEAGIANEAIAEGDRLLAARYLHASLGHALSQEPPYGNREVLREARRVAAAMGHCDLAHQIGALQRIAGEIRELRYGEGTDAMAVVPGTGSAGPTVELECGSAGEAVRLVLSDEQARQAQIDALFQDYVDEGGDVSELTYDMSRSELVLLYDRASSDTKRARLVEAIHRLMPDAVEAFGAAPTETDVRFVRIWAEGAAVSGQRQAADTALLDLYNALPADPLERMALLITLLPALRDG